MCDRKIFWKKLKFDKQKISCSNHILPNPKKITFNYSCTPYLPIYPSKSIIYNRLTSLLLLLQFYKNETLSQQPTTKVTKVTMITITASMVLAALAGEVQGLLSSHSASTALAGEDQGSSSLKRPTTTTTPITILKNKNHV